MKCCGETKLENLRTRRLGRMKSRIPLETTDHSESRASFGGGSHRLKAQHSGISIPYRRQALNRRFEEVGGGDERASEQDPGAAEDAARNADLRCGRLELVVDQTRSGTYDRQCSEAAAEPAALFLSRRKLV